MVSVPLRFNPSWQLSPIQPLAFTLWWDGGRIRWVKIYEVRGWDTDNLTEENKSSTHKPRRELIHSFLWAGRCSSVSRKEGLRPCLNMCNSCLGLTVKLVLWLRMCVPSPFLFLPPALPAEHDALWDGESLWSAAAGALVVSLPSSLYSPASLLARERTRPCDSVST